MSITNNAGSDGGCIYNHAIVERDEWKDRAESAIADVSRLLRERDEEIARAERAEEELRSRHQEHFRMRERAQRAERIVEAVKKIECIFHDTPLDGAPCCAMVLEVKKIAESP